MVPALASIDLATSPLPSVRSLVLTHSSLLARRGAVAEAFDAIDATAQAEAAAPRAPGHRPLAYHPTGLPLASSLPTLAGMDDTSCKTNTRAQRKFAQVVHLGNWVGLVEESAALGGWEGRREASRLIGVAQPLAGAWLLAIPSVAGFRIRSDLFAIAAQRRLGLPITMLAQSAPSYETLQYLLGDVALGQGEHTYRHDRVVREWVVATRAVRGAAGTYTTTSAPAWSGLAVPDFVSECAGQDAGHLVGEVKVYNPVLAAVAWQRRGASRPFGATEAHLRSLILGELATQAGAARAMPRCYASGPRKGTPRVAQYQAALDQGHTVVPLISEVWGGFAPEAVSYLRGLAQARSDRLDIEQESTTWTTRSFTSYYGQRLSVALTMGVAHEIRRTATGAHQPEGGGALGGGAGRRRRGRG